MRKKKVVSIGLIMGLMVAANLFIFFWPRAAQAENEMIYAGDYSGWWDYSNNSWGSDYALWPSSLYNSSSWEDNNYLRSLQSYNISGEADLLGLLSQGLNIYTPPGSSLFGVSYGGLGSPGGYLPSSQWPAYSYATPISPFGMYTFQPYPGGPIETSMRPKTREEWWANQVWHHSLEFAKEYGQPWLPGFCEVPPWEKQPNVIIH